MRLLTWSLLALGIVSGNLSANPHYFTDIKSVSTYIQQEYESGRPVNEVLLSLPAYKYLFAPGRLVADPYYEDDYFLFEFAAVVDLLSRIHPNLGTDSDRTDLNALSQLLSVSGNKFLELCSLGRPLATPPEVNRKAVLDWSLAWAEINLKIEIPGSTDCTDVIERRGQSGPRLP